MTDTAGRCVATIADGRRCRNYAVIDGFCRVHAPAEEPQEPQVPAPEPEPEPEPQANPSSGLGDQLDALRHAVGEEWFDRLRELVAVVLRRFSGQQVADPVDFDERFMVEVLLPVMQPLYRHWWRVWSTGTQHIPPASGGVIVANRAGVVAADAVMMGVDVWEWAGRHVRGLDDDLSLRTPFMGTTGPVTDEDANETDADRFLGAGELVAVWPEGRRGTKPYSERYSLQRFGRGRFVEAALRHQVPIIPTAIVGAEEIYPVVADLKPLAQLLGLPSFPLTAQMLAIPVLGPLAVLPLPSKWSIAYGEPIETADLGPDAIDDPMTVFDLTDQVRNTIQEMLREGLSGRDSVFL